MIQVREDGAWTRVVAVGAGSVSGRIDMISFFSGQFPYWGQIVNG